MPQSGPIPTLPVRRSAARLPRTSDATRVVFSDPASRAFEERLALLAPTDVTVLITGETGTGKEVAARELHARSGRSGPFLAVNCGALTETLAEAELFGHERGAFTGAVKSQPGWFEAAAGGTLLLDEIGEMPLPIQAKLLRVLQQREVTRVGSRTPRPLDVRIVAATNIDLEAAVACGGFRRDLLFRLNVATVALRPLRARPQDIPPLAQHFLAIYGARFGRPPQHFAEDALDALRRYPWPGNVRELDNVVHRAALLNCGPVIRAADLSLTDSLPDPVADATPAGGQSGDSQPAALEAALRRLAEGWMRDREPDLLRRATQVLVEASFDASGNNQSKAADILGVSRNTLRTRLGQLGVIAPRRRAGTASVTGWVRARIGTQRFGTSALLRLGGELERRLAALRILVDWHDFATGPLMMAALHAGEIDIGSTGEVPPVFAQANGTPVVYLAYEEPAPASVALVVRGDGPIGRVADLKGRRVAFSHGANVHLLLLRALGAHGLAMADIDPVSVGPGAACGPSAAADADAWMMWDPFLTELQRAGRHRTLVDGTGLVANHRFYLARRDFAEALPDVVDAVIGAAQRVGVDAAERPATAAHHLASSFGMGPDALETVMRRLGGGVKPLDDRVVRAQQVIANQFHQQGILPRPIRVADAVWR